MADKEVIVTSGGGGTPKGGQVVLIFVVLMTGYLYVTGKLQAVVKAVQSSGNLNSFGGPGGLGGTVTPLPSTASPTLGPSIPDPSLGRAQYPARFTLAFDPRYRAGPVQIEAADVVTCRQLVYNTAYQVTGSMSLATQYADQFCP